MTSAEDVARLNSKVTAINQPALRCLAPPVLSVGLVAVNDPSLLILRVFQANFVVTDIGGRLFVLQTEVFKLDLSNRDAVAEGQVEACMMYVCNSDFNVNFLKLRPAVIACRRPR
jgi:hypothetical protein